MNFANIRDNKIIDFNSKYLDKDIQRVEVTEEIYNAYLEDRDKVIFNDGSVILNPNYEQEQEEKERTRIAGLKLTKRVFALALQEFEITYSQLKELIATNEQAQLEWDLCVELERSNPLLNVMGAKLGITPEELDYIFRKANGEEVEPPEVEEPTDEEPEEEMGNE